WTEAPAVAPEGNCTQNDLPSGNTARLRLAKFAPSLERKPIRVTSLRASNDHASTLSARRKAFKRPFLHFAVLVLHIGINQGVRVFPLDLGDDGLHRHRLVTIEGH